MAVKINRQPKNIALLGVPTSAAALRPGHERAPAALRAAGLVEKLQAAGYEVTDLGDCATQTYQPDEEHPRARNVAGVLATLHELKPKIEQAVKSGALPVVLSGDCSVVLATVAGVRRYFRNVSLVYIDADADLNVPASTPSGCVDGMAISHIIGRGAPELVRFWGEPPLVREPNVALFGVSRLDPAEEQFLARSPLRKYQASDIERQGAAAVAESVLERIPGGNHEFILHLDVDAISGEDFRATDLPGEGGLRLQQIREALHVFLRRKNIAAVEVTAYNPELDPDGSGAKLLVDLLAEALGERLEAFRAEEEAAAAAAAPEGGDKDEAAAAVKNAAQEAPAEVAAAESASGSVPGAEETATATEQAAEPQITDATAADEPPATEQERALEEKQETVEAQAPGEAESPTEPESSNS